MLLDVAQNKLTIKFGNKIAPSVRGQNKNTKLRLKTKTRTPLDHSLPYLTLLLH